VLWWHGVVVSALALINVVNQHRAQLLHGWMTVCGKVNSSGVYPYLLMATNAPWSVWWGNPLKV